MMSRPIPPSSPIEISATMLPTTAPAAARRSDGTRYGTDVGSFNRTSVFHQPAAAQRKYSLCTALGALRPRVIPTATGKNARYAAITATDIHGCHSNEPIFE